MLRFTIPGPPIPMARPRFDRRSGRVYTDPRSDAYRRHVAGCALVARAGTTWPKAEACARARARMLGKRKKPKCGCAWCASRFTLKLVVVQPDRRVRDLDNVAKQIQDACNGVLWYDDSQIAKLEVERAINPSNPRVEVLLEEANMQHTLIEDAS